MAPLAVSPAEFLFLGFDIRGAKLGGPTRNRRRFVSWFGTIPPIVSAIWTLLIQAGWLNTQNNPQPRHLLWALFFLKCYSSEETNAASVGGVDEKTFRKHAWFNVRGLAFLSDVVVRWENRYLGDTGERALITVDGTDCPIQEPFPWRDGVNCKFFSHKFNGAGLKYEIGVSIKSGDIVWYNGPFPAGMNDLQVFPFT